jgi:hypothetical protein
MSVPRSRFVPGQQPEAKNLTFTFIPAHDWTNKQLTLCPATRWQITQFAADPNMLRKLAHFNRLICPPKLLEKCG